MLLTAARETGPARSVRLDDAWVPGPGGDVHALYARPEGTTGPVPTLFMIHGGPQAADEDRYSAVRAVWLDAGFAVVHVNYRGSSGYGSAWRDAIEGRPGTTELEDIAVVHAWAVEAGLADPQACVLEGWSWGGYLTLLGLGRSPSAGPWAARASRSRTTSPRTRTRWSRCARSTGRCSAAHRPRSPTPTGRPRR